MQFTIDANTIDFQLQQGNEVHVIEGKRKRGEITDIYTSENKVLSEFIKDSPTYSVKLVNVFDSISDFENALHKLYYYCKITEGSHTFAFIGDNITMNESFTGVAYDDINVNIKKTSTKIKAEVNIKILRTAS